MDTARRTLSYLTALSYLTSSAMAAFSPVWSPDGRQIAFSAGPDIGFVGGGDVAKSGAAQRRLWVMDRDGADLRQLTQDAAYRDERPRWSADGSQILFARVDAAGNQGSLWLIAVRGGQPRVVADGLSWSSKGEPLWFGYYGHIDWDRFYDWWPGMSVLKCGSARPQPAPCRQGAVINTSYPYQLYTHCGIIWAYFDGRWWKADPMLDDGNGNPPAGWGNPFDNGHMVLLNASAARFRSASGSFADFSPLPREAQANPGKMCS